MLGATGGRLRAAGFSLRRPFASFTLVPLSGRLDGVDIDRRTDEGAAVRIRLSLAYRIDPGALAARAAELESSGLGGVVAERAGTALDPMPLTGLLPADPAQGSAPLPRSASASIEGSLRAAGIEPRDLIARIGPPGSFAEASSAPTAEATGLRVLLIGLDGADWDTIGPLMRAGRMPNLTRLVNGGAHGSLRSYDPMISPLLWTTMVTGVGPDVHGVADFQAIDDATGRRVPITSRFRRVKALWNILSDAGRPSAFVAWWASYPAEKVDGVQVSNLVVFQTLRPRPPGAAPPAGITYPPGYFEQVLPSLHTAADLTYEETAPILHIDRAEYESALHDVLQPAPAGDEKEARRLAQRPVPLAISILAGSKNYAAIASDLAARRMDLTAVYFEGIDMMGHRFQHCMPPRLAICPEGDYRRYRDAVIGFYVMQDGLIGRIVEAAGPGTTVMVVSDHGFKTGAGRPQYVLPYTTEQPVEWHRENGIFMLSGPGARPGPMAPRATLFDIAPTLLYLLGFPASEEMPGRVLVEAIDPAFVAAHPVRTIPSYERIGAPRATTVVASGQDAREAEEELLAGLRALGYIGGDSAGGAHAGASETQGGDTGPGGAELSASAGDAPPGGAPHSGPSSGASDGAGATTQVFYHRNLATYFMKRRDYAQAAEQLRLANERQKLPKNYQLLSEAYLGLGQPDLALGALEEGLRTMESMDPESVLWMVRLALSKKEGRVMASDIARRWAARTAKRPGLDDAIAGLLAEDSGEQDNAVALYLRSLQVDPTRVVAAQHLFALLPPGQRGRLEPTLRRALTRDPRIDELHNLLGILLAGSGRAGEALDEFRRAEELDPENPRFLVNLAGACAQVQRWDEAAAAYERACAASPSSAIYLKLGSVYRRLAQPERAFAAFRWARDLGDDGSAPFLGMALAKAELNRMQEATELARQGLGLHPEDASLRSVYDDLVRRSRSPGSPPGPPGSGR
jgi:tetratricopeptide (TPR) repeat protein